jgi:hypothetical protein
MSKSGNIACGCTIMFLSISFILLIIHIIYYEDGNIYGDLALYFFGITFILWVVSINIKDDPIKNKTKVTPIKI